MGHESKQVDRREIEVRRDALVNRQNIQRRLKLVILPILNLHVSKDSSSNARHEALWIVSVLDSRIAELGEYAERCEILLQMLNEEKEKEIIDILFIDGERA